ncbi:hypothetical protein H6P81_010054 [Aristolochia fimbriata]|uniref:Uncharacterized protein n=1 Tax=Aristolochia fimbriata TaxID=158543 RepID=A0AAV7ENK7_ARIFI|nr:hypothetical protein H6P81_010054 [Aristolochia fimbriata]
MDNRLTTRCSPVFFLETIQKAKLKEKHIRAIKKTPFGHFLEVKGGHIDLNGLKEYAWGEALHRHIVLQLSRKKAKNNGYFTGCALAVTVWYYETMSRLGKFTFCTNKLVDPTAVPCVLKWGSNKVHRSGAYEEVHQQTRDLQEEWEEGEGVAAHLPQAEAIISQL